jgi:hypothetical protein
VRLDELRLQQLKYGMNVCCKKFNRAAEYFPAIINRIDEERCRVTFEDQSVGWRKARAI